MIVQNLDTIFLKIDTSTNEVFLPKDRFLENSKIGYFIPFYANDRMSYSPSGVALLPNANKLFCYFDFYEKDKDYLAKNFNANIMTEENFNLFPINRVLDYDISKIKIRANLGGNYYLGLCAVYVDSMKQFIAPSKDSVTFVVKNPQKGKIKLSEIGGYQMNGKKITRITTKNDSEIYFTIRTKDNQNNINQMPLFLLNESRQFSDREMIFDSLQIDSDNSYFEVVANKDENLIITFKF